MTWWTCLTAKDVHQIEPENTHIQNHINIAHKPELECSELCCNGYILVVNPPV